MSIGAGIIWSTLIVLLAVAIWRTTVNRKWKTVGKAFGAIILLGVVIGLGAWGWHKYQQRLKVVAALGGAAIGMSPTDVTLALGAPNQKGLPTEQSQMRYVYRHSYDKDYWLLIGFKETDKQYAVNLICEYRGSGNLLGIGNNATETAMIDRLGKWAKRSVSDSGLKQIVSYPQWKAAYILEEGIVQGVCTSEDGDVSYEEDSPSLRPWEQFDPSTAEPVRRQD